MKPLIIIPTYNEEQNIKEIIDKIEQVLNSVDFSILVVDDNSKDKTPFLVSESMKKYSNIMLLNRNGKLGLASAYIDGIKYGIEKGFDSFIEMDADFSHNPKYLPIMFENLSNYDLVIGSRNIKDGSVVGWGLARNIISKGGSLYSKLILNCPINDLTGGFNGWKLDLINKIGLDNIISKGYCFQIEMKYRAYKNNAKIKEFPIIFEDRKYGKSKMSKQIFIEAFLNIIKLKFLVK